MEKNKLEIKHLAPYLPYELKFKDPETITPGVMVSIVAGMPGLLFYGHIDNIEYFDLSQIKPILRPLSDLYKPVKTGGTIPVEVLYMKHKRKPPIELYTDVKNGNYAHWKYEFLFEHHFDVFGLIDKNLAIDLNTLPQ